MAARRRFVKPIIFAACYYHAAVLSARARGWPGTFPARRLLSAAAAADDARRMTPVSCSYVEAHKAHIMRKLGVRGTAELVRYAIRIGAIDIDLAEPAALRAAS